MSTTPLDWVKKYPLTALAAAFAGGMSTGLGAGGLVVGAALKLVRSEPAKELVSAAWPIAKQAAVDSVKISATAAAARAVAQVRDAVMRSDDDEGEYDEDYSTSEA